MRTRGAVDTVCFLRLLLKSMIWKESQKKPGYKLETEITGAPQRRNSINSLSAIFSSFEVLPESLKIC